jgi:hypothetical protein
MYVECDILRVIFPIMNKSILDLYISCEIKEVDIDSI